jgi:kinesin family protein 4/21/27
MGTGLDGNVNTENQGIVPRAIYTIFENLPKRYESPSTFQVFVSFLELYNEELVDLLNPSKDVGNQNFSGPLGGRPASAPSTRHLAESSLRIREDEYGNIVWVGVREELCNSPDELLGHLAKGSLCRTTGSTDMNMVSSRSHAIFSVSLRLNKVDSQGLTEKIYCKFHFVDLAGSERVCYAIDFTFE